MESEVKLGFGSEGLAGRQTGTMLRYALITPARNEADFIELTIKSVIAQTVLPVKWIIVSDGSTDRTDEIVNSYVTQHSWIELLRMPERRERNFAGKAYAFNTGREELAHLTYEIIGNLDADVSFEPDYFAFLLDKFAVSPTLGVAGTPFREGSFQYDFRFTSVEHVSGQIQMFRRECFEEIGGYLPLKRGGVDLAAVMTARMKGWKTQSFIEKTYEHHRKMGSAKHGKLTADFYGGRVDYLLGCDPLWEVLRSFYRMGTRKPLILHGVLTIAGFFWAMLTRSKKAWPEDLVRFRRAEERRRLRELLKRHPRQIHNVDQLH